MGGYHSSGTGVHEVFLNGIVRDTQHRKMSKSLVQRHRPARRWCALRRRRLALHGPARVAIGTDVILEPDDSSRASPPAATSPNKLWNVGRFILTNPARGSPAPSALDPLRFELATAGSSPSAAA